jgi:hypothetical protein
VAISCPTSSVCGVVDTSGNLISSTNATGGAGAWTVRQIDPGGDLVDISCPSRASCYAVDATGNVLKAIAPSTSTTAAVDEPWTPMKVDPSGNLMSIDCVQGDCFATDYQGNIFSSSDPAGGASSWKSITVPDGEALTDISCPATTFCVAVGARGGAWVSTNPTGGAGAWKGGLGMPGGASGVSCTQALLHALGQQTWCVIVGSQDQFAIGTIPQLGVSRDGTGSGSVGSSTSIACPSQCSALIPAGTSVTFTATPSASSAFSTWSPNCTSTQAQPLSCTITANQPYNTIVAAVFSPAPVSGGGVITLGGGTGLTTLQCRQKTVCTGTALLTAPAGSIARTKKKTKPTILGTARFRIKPHRGAAVRFVLTAAGKRLARRHKLRRAIETITTNQPTRKRLVSVRTVELRY